MPTYEYRCPEGHSFELFQRMSDPPVAKCPDCGAQAERLLSTGAGLLFKGSGFYITDYRPDSYKKAAESDSASEGKGGGEKKGGDASGTSKGTGGAAGATEKAGGGSTPSAGKDAGSSGGTSGKSGGD